MSIGTDESDRDLSLAVWPQSGFGDVISEGAGCDICISRAQSGGMPNEAVIGRRPNTTENASVWQRGKPPLTDAEWLRRVADLNEEFTDNLRRNGTVIMGSTRTRTVG